MSDIARNKTDPISRQPNRALEILTHLTPPDVMLRARDLSRQIDGERVGMWRAVAVALSVTAAVLLGIVGFYVFAKLNRAYGPMSLTAWALVNLFWFCAWTAVSVKFVRWLDRPRDISSKPDDIG